MVSCPGILGLIIVSDKRDYAIEIANDIQRTHEASTNIGIGVTDSSCETFDEYLSCFWLRCINIFEYKRLAGLLKDKRLVFGWNCWGHFDLEISEERDSQKGGEEG